MNFFENWYTSSHWHNNNTGKVSWTSEVWIKRYEKVLDRQTDTQTTRSGPSYSPTDLIAVGQKHPTKWGVWRIFFDLGFVPSRRREPSQKSNILKREKHICQYEKKAVEWKDPKILNHQGEDYGDVNDEGEDDDDHLDDDRDIDARFDRWH